MMDAVGYVGGFVLTALIAAIVVLLMVKLTMAIVRMYQGKREFGPERQSFGAYLAGLFITLFAVGLLATNGWIPLGRALQIVAVQMGHQLQRLPGYQK